MAKYKSSSFNIFEEWIEPAKDESVLGESKLIAKTTEGECDETEKTLEMKPMTLKAKRTRKTAQFRIKKGTGKARIEAKLSGSETEGSGADDLTDEEEEMLRMRQRISRFLSVCDLPDEVVAMTQQSFEQRIHTQETIEEEDEEATELDVTKTGKMDTERKGRNPKLKGSPSRQHSFMNSNKFSYYERGYGLSQEEKTRIITDIIRDFDLERYVDEFKEKQVLSIKLKKYDGKNRPVRDRLMKLMQSDEIRINDSHYMRKLSRQIERSYEEKQERLMNNLIENEKKRERMLKLKGLLSKTTEEMEQPVRITPRRSVRSPHLTALSLRKITLR